MAEFQLRQGPLSHLHLAARAATGDAAVLLAESPPTGYIGLRGDSARKPFVSGAAKALGFELPLVPNKATGKAGTTALWLGPDEWLVTTPLAQRDEKLKDLHGALRRTHRAIVDLSDARCTIAVAGARARDVLAKGCPIDLHPRVFGPGDCAQSLFGKASILLYQVDGRPSYHLTVTRSFAEYLWLRLEDAAAEYGHVVVEA